MSDIILITGGARSGKSRLAEKLAARYGAPLGYLATAAAGDAEMAARIARHQARRGGEWQTLEEPYDLLGVLRGHDGWFRAVLVDCVTLWLTNLFLRHGDSGRVLAEVRELAAAFAGLATPLILVTNEVGMGIVPENALARSFRDLAGEANEILATASDEVYVTFAGLPLKLKSRPSTELREMLERP
ncbi:MAG TPA: bifunctional adenosylcobinamide kinase/adenosylcobinamide-phosphate guanylyltransferase [Geobacteraceae bacterium]